MILLKMSANGWRTAALFFNYLKKMSSCEAYVFCTAQRTWKFVDHTVLINQRGLFEVECKELRSIFSKLKYPNELVDSAISFFIKSKLLNVSSPPVVPGEQPVWILLPFKDKKSADASRKQLNNLSNRIGTPLQAIYTSRKLGDALNVK